MVGSISRSNNETSPDKVLDHAAMAETLLGSIPL